MNTLAVASSAIALAAMNGDFGRKNGGGTADAPSIEQLSTQVSDALKQVQDFASKAADSVRKGEEQSTATKAQIDEALTKFNTLSTELTARVNEVEQKAARTGPMHDRPTSAGERFINDEGFKSFAGQTRPRGRAIVEVKDITSLTTNAPGSAGSLVQSDRLGLQVPLPQRRMTVRALLAQGTMSASSIEYEREVLFTNNAAPVAEGTLKPQSELQFEDATATARTIAHWMRASVQILEDAPALRSIIDQRLRYGLSFAEEVQLLNGSGTQQNLLGLVTAATAYSVPGDLSASDAIDIIRAMILQVALAEYPANGIVLNPIDWAAIEMMKDEQGRYLIGNPQGMISPTLWGLPVVATQAMGVDKALVGAFDLAAQIFDRQDATVEVSTEDQDNFVKNKVTIRAEERLALAIYRPAAIVYGDLGRVTPTPTPTPTPA